MPSILLNSLFADLSQVERQVHHLLADIELQEQVVERRKDIAVDAHQNWQAWERTPRHVRHSDHHNIIREAHQRFLSLDAEVKRAERVAFELKHQARSAETEAGRLTNAIHVMQRTREREERERQDEDFRALHRREREGHHCSSSSRDPRRSEPSRSRSHRHAETRSHHRPRYEERRPSIPVEPRTSHSQSYHYEQPRSRYEERRPTNPVEPRTYSSRSNHYESDPRPRYEERRPSYAQPSPPPRRSHHYEHYTSSSSSSRRERAHSHSRPHSTDHDDHPPQPRYEERRPPPQDDDEDDYPRNSSSSHHTSHTAAPHPPPPRHHHTPQPPPPISPAIYKTWYALTQSTLSCSASSLSPSSTSTSFPYPPPLPAVSSLHARECRGPEPDRANKACDCAIKAAFLAVGLGSGVVKEMKKEMRRWHPDKFMKIGDEKAREEWQRAASEVFVVLGEMVEEAEK